MCLSVNTSLPIINEFFYIFILTVFLLLVMTASITGGLAVVMTILSSRDPNVKNNYLMLNLALSDLLLGKKS